MATIKVNPDKLSAGVTKVKKYLEDYKKTYKKLTSVIENNDAKLDANTQSALLESCKKMETNFNEMASFLEMAMEVTSNVAKEFKAANDNSLKKIQTAGNKI